MCTNSVLIYRETYRALRANASGRSNVNPIQTLKQMQSVVPFSVCGKIESTMMKALTSFNQRYLAPVGVYEPCANRRAKMLMGGAWFEYPPTHLDGRSVLHHMSKGTVHIRLMDARNRAYARKAFRHVWQYRLYGIDTRAAWLKVMNRAALSA